MPNILNIILDNLFKPLVIYIINFNFNSLFIT